MSNRRALTPPNLIRQLTGTQVLQGLLTPFILVFILVLANRRSVLGDAANGPVFRAVAGASVVAVATLSTVLLVETVVGWFRLGMWAHVRMVAATAGISALGTLVVALATTSVSIARAVVVSCDVWLESTLGWAVVLWTREQRSRAAAGR